MSSEGDRGPAAPGEHPENWKKRGSATDMGGADARSPAAQRRGKRWLLIALLGLIVLIALIVAEQRLIRELDRRAIWQDGEFKAYLANPGHRHDDKVISYDCQYRPIGWIYRYRICIMDAGSPGYYYLIVIGVKGYLSLLPENGVDREIWDRTLIWSLDENLKYQDDRRAGVRQ